MQVEIMMALEEKFDLQLDEEGETQCHGHMPPCHAHIRLNDALALPLTPPKQSL